MDSYKSYFAIPKSEYDLQVKSKQVNLPNVKHLTVDQVNFNKAGEINPSTFKGESFVPYSTNSAAHKKNSTSSKENAFPLQPANDNARVSQNALHTTLTLLPSQSPNSNSQSTLQNASDNAVHSPILAEIPAQQIPSRNNNLQMETGAAQQYMETDAPNFQEMQAQNADNGNERQQKSFLRQEPILNGNREVEYESNATLSKAPRLEEDNYSKYDNTTQMHDTNIDFLDGTIKTALASTPSKLDLNTVRKPNDYFGKSPARAPNLAQKDMTAFFNVADSTDNSIIDKSIEVTADNLKKLQAKQGAIKKSAPLKSAPPKPANTRANAKAGANAKDHISAKNISKSAHVPPSMTTRQMKMKPDVHRS